MFVCFILDKLLDKYHFEIHIDEFQFNNFKKAKIRYYNKNNKRKTK